MVVLFPRRPEILQTSNYIGVACSNLCACDCRGSGTMKTKVIGTILPLCVFFFLLKPLSCNASNYTFTLSSCFLSANLRNFTLLSSQTTAYDSLLNSSIHNLRFTAPSIPKPIAIILPHTKQQLQTAVLCCRRTSVTIRILSGGHSYEGLSYTGEPGQPFAIIDLLRLNRVTVDTTSATAWVESGATVGEIYRTVAEASNTLALPAGSCSTVGSGGHIAGGGFGFLSRRYGLSADNVIDAVLVDAAGRALDRSSMEEDVFWAIRGGGGGSWGAVYAWRVQLVRVPNRVTTLGLQRHGTISELAELVHKWQFVAPSLPDEFYLSVTLGADSVSFDGMFLGARSSAISLLGRRFAELGAVESDCTEMSWVDSVVHFAGLGSIAELSNRTEQGRSYFKAKSDYVRTPIAVERLIGLMNWLVKEPAGYIIMDPYGGAMSRIRSDRLPFPHRRGNIYGVQYMVSWTAEEDWRRDGFMSWIRGLYEYMEPSVSRNPRAAYANYLDLDLGSNGSTVEAARAYGEKYFMENFDRLVRAKTLIDPDNVFSCPQSIPPSTR